jgi:NAD(P)-dependent dehydrogenase (short-subunit alcohol dehydrogenase family)
MDASTTPLADVTEQEWDRVSSVNIKGVFLSMKYEIPAMLARGGGAIVNASSVLGLVGSSNGAVYAASKHAVAGLTRCAALDYARAGIRVNATAPGMIDTPMIDRTAVNMGMPKEAFGEFHPLGRIGGPEEVAEAVLWLCSPRSAFVTGTVITIDGGWTAQ